MDGTQNKSLRRPPRRWRARLGSHRNAGPAAVEEGCWGGDIEHEGFNPCQETFDGGLVVFDAGLGRLQLVEQEYMLSCSGSLALLHLLTQERCAANVVGNHFLHANMESLSNTSTIQFMLFHLVPWDAVSALMALVAVR